MTEREIFDAALAIADPAGRAAYLASACGDPARRDHIVGLLEAHSKLGSFLEAPPSALARRSDATLDQQPPERPGTQIGPYKLLQQIGEGGMGVVYMAEQEQPVRRRVALKIIKPGMDSRQVIARFEAERQALSLMDHPNIAKVLDAGTTDSGRPYFVMELVKGQPITQYCDEQHLTPRQRLELLLPVCQAIQHAHQKGIIHRDIKPTNILVAEYDHQPVPKVIDFGVAKATSQALTEKTMFTGFGQIVGTLEYMSPEQAKVNQLDIDTRSDIYSLGVLLYELLTGSTPFDKTRLRSAAFDEMLRIIREEEPPKPSTRLSDSGEALASISAQRHTEPAKLSKLVRGELDWIVMKALEKDRNRRYETANGLAMDIQRYLADEQVQACPPSAAYRFRKFARRNKRILATVGVIALALLVGTAISTWQAIRATNAEDLAETRLKAETAAKGKAVASQTAAEKAQQNEAAQRTEAERQATIATGNEQRAKQQELLARRRYDAAQTNLAEQAWEAGQPARTLELLETQRPKLDQEDLRGFEWYYLWRLCHRNLQRTLNGPSGETVYTLAVTPDETTLVSASRGDSVRVWDVATGKERAVLMGHQASIWRFAISPDGNMVATASMDHTVKLWDLGTSEMLGTLTAGFKVRSAAFAPDGKVLAVGTEDGGLELWDVAARQRRLTLPAHFAPTVALAYSPDGKLLASGAGWSTNRGPGGVTVWDATSEPLRIVFQAPEARWAAFSPDSKLLATCGGFGVKVWHATSGELQTTLKAPGVDSVAFSADGNSVVVGGRDRTVKLWEFATGATRTVGVHLGAVKTVACFPRSNLLASGSNDGTMKVWHAGPPEDGASYAHDSAIRSLAFTADSQLLVVGSDLLTPVLDADTGKKTTTLPASGVLAASADANLLVASAPDDKRVIWDVGAGRARVVLPVGPDFSGAAFSRNGKTLVTWIGNPERSPKVGVRLWDLETSRVRLTFKLHGESMVFCAAFSPDGRTLATGQQFGWVTLWDPTTGQQRITLQQKETTNCDAVAVAFSSNGKLLAAGNSEGIVRLWNVETGQLQVTFQGHTEEIRSVAFSPDDKTLLSGSGDRTARLWDVATGQEVLSLKEHKFPVHLVAFAPDGKRLATASHNEVQLWLAATQPEAAAFRVELDRDDPESPRALNNWGDRLQEIRRSQEAGLAYGQARVRLVKLATAVPALPEYRQELAYSLLADAVLPSSTYRAQTAEQAHREIREAYVTLPPDQQRTLVLRYQKLSRLLATGPDPQLRNPILALEFAKRTVELFPNDVSNWHTLGVAHYFAGDGKNAADATAAFRKAIELDANSTIAWQYLGWSHYRTGHWQPSIETLEKSCELQKGGKGDAGQWIVLALAHAKLAGQEGLPENEREHHKAEARRWFDEADKQIESWWRTRPGNVTDRAIWNFRAEARELMQKQE